MVCGGGDGGVLQRGGDVNGEIGMGDGCVNVDKTFEFSVDICDKVNDIIITNGRHWGRKDGLCPQSEKEIHPTHSE